VRRLSGSSGRGLRTVTGGCAAWIDRQVRDLFCGCLDPGDEDPAGEPDL
jgi:hypothetical protein